MDTCKLLNEEKQLCAVIHSVVSGKACPDCLENEAEHKAFFRLCIRQKLQGMAYMCIKNNPSFLALSSEGKDAWHKNFLSSAAIQREKTAIFTKAFNEIPRDGSWFTVKGIALRGLYPVPELRPSGDEDIRVAEDKFDEFVSRLINLGFELDCKDSLQAVLKKGVLTLEVEKFSGEIPHTVTDMSGFPTLAPTEHLVFLINHAAEHFCHGGFGIRILSDLNIFALHYQNDIDWDRFFILLADKKLFALHLFSLCSDIFGENLPCPILLKLDGFKTDTFPLLKDILDSGIYGTCDEARKLSGRLTSLASQNGILRAAFPSASHMKNAYPVLNKCILLLPFFYIYRLISYSLRAVFTRDKKDNGSGISLGMERLVLIKKYGLSNKHKG